MGLLIHARSPVNEAALDDADRQATILFLSDDALTSVDQRSCDRLLGRRCMLVALAGGELGGPALATALDADWLAVREGSALLLAAPSIDPRVASALPSCTGSFSSPASVMRSTLFRSVPAYPHRCWFSPGGTRCEVFGENSG